MLLNIEIKKPTINQWKWFVGLYLASILGYGVVELGLHYINEILVSL